MTLLAVAALCHMSAGLQRLPAWPPDRLLPQSADRHDVSGRSSRRGSRLRRPEWGRLALAPEERVATRAACAGIPATRRPWLPSRVFPSCWAPPGSSPGASLTAFTPRPLRRLRGIARDECALRASSQPESVTTRPLPRGSFSSALRCWSLSADRSARSGRGLDTLLGSLTSADTPCRLASVLPPQHPLMALPLQRVESPPLGCDSLRWRRWPSASSRHRFPARWPLGRAFQLWVSRLVGGTRRGVSGRPMSGASRHHDPGLGLDHVPLLRPPHPL